MPPERYTAQEITGLIELARNSQIRLADEANNASDYEASRGHKHAATVLDGLIDKIRAGRPY